MFADRAARIFVAATSSRGSWELRAVYEKAKIRSAIGEARSSHIGPGQQLVLYRVVHMVSPTYAALLTWILCELFVSSVVVAFPFMQYEISRNMISYLSSKGQTSIASYF